MTVWNRVRYSLNTLWNWIHSNLHNFYDAYRVLRFMYWRKLHAGLIDRGHPWVTGISPHTGREIWADNIIYAAPRTNDSAGVDHETDEIIVTRVARFLTAMVERSTFADPEIPQSSKRRMPHAVNYLHGTVHFNGGYLIFEDCRDLINHITDPTFVGEMRRFSAEQSRELIVVLRERQYDPEEYAWCLGVVRAHIPWYANANGPKRPGVLWGTPSPYPVINPINGSWARDVENLRRGRMEHLVRPPIPQRCYFQGSYHGTRSEATWLERFHAWAIFSIIRVRGFQGPLVFTSRKRIEPRSYRQYKQTGRKKWRSIQPVSNPFLRSKKKPNL